MRHNYTMNKIISNMSFLNLFRKEKAVQSPSLIANEVEEPTINHDSESKVADNNDTVNASSNPLTVTYATGWPIDVIYGNLHKNYEQRGYDDAMVNSNLSFRDMNIAIIRNKILMIFREVNLKYDGMKRDMETRISTCNAAGLLTTVAELEIQLSVINSHKEELRQLELDFRNNEKEASVPVTSYECGFLRGISTIALTAPAKVQPAPQISVSPFLNSNKVTA